MVCMPSALTENIRVSVSSRYIDEHSDYGLVKTTPGRAQGGGPPASAPGVERCPERGVPARDQRTVTCAAGWIVGGILRPRGGAR